MAQHPGRWEGNRQIRRFGTPARSARSVLNRSLFMNSGLNSEVLNLFYSIQNGFETILFYSILKRRRELFRSCSNRRLGPMSKRWITVWCTNLIRFLYESTANCFKKDLSATLSPTLIKRIHYWYFWTHFDPFQTTPDTREPCRTLSSAVQKLFKLFMNSPE